MNERLHGLYAITADQHNGLEHLRSDVEAALTGGARVIQYRDKSSDTGRRQREARVLRDLCAAFDAPFIVNDDIELAASVGADGVHIGRDDGGLEAARRFLGNEFLIGVSCYNDFDLARQAVAGGADYVAFGSFFASPTKPHAVTATPSLLRRARDELRVPVVAIGGISPENGAALVRDGADMLAVISAVFGADDITAAARAFAHCFYTAEETT